MFSKRFAWWAFGSNFAFRLSFRLGTSPDLAFPFAAPFFIPALDAVSDGIYNTVLLSHFETDARSSASSTILA